MKGDRGRKRDRSIEIACIFNFETDRQKKKERWS